MTEDTQKILCLITARGGSKRVLRKNVKDLLGKPLIAWTVETAKESKVLDRIVLTTDDEEIADAGRKAGAEVPFMRPAELAGDTATSYQAVRHAVEWLKENEGYETEWIILLEPTSPGRRPFHVSEVAKLIREKGSEFDSIIGITEMPGHFSHLKEFNLTDTGIMERVGDKAGLKQIISRNQDVPTSYYINSSIYAFKVKNLYDGDSSLWGDSTYGYLIEEKYATDIDTPEDWMIAEVKMRRLTLEGN